jgi:hypothetical protein
MDDFFRQVLAARNDPREVITDPKAVYFGVSPAESSLVPDDGAILGATTYATWSGRAAADS